MPLWAHWGGCGAAALVAGMLAGLACGDTFFECQANEQCQGGMCESTGWCSFPDDTCESGRRYGSLAGDGLATVCVGVGDTAAGTGSSGSSLDSSDTPPGTDETTGVSPLDDGSEGSTAAAVGSTSTSAGSSDSSSTGTEPARCGNGVVEAGEDCDTRGSSPSCNEWCREPGTLLWEDDFHATDNDRAYDLSVAGDGSFVVVGFVGEPGDIMLLRYDADGTEDSEELIDIGGDAAAWGVDHNAQGEFFVTGFGGGPTPWAAGFSEDGMLEWEVFDETGGRYWSVIVSPQNDVFVIGDRHPDGDASASNLLVQLLDPSNGLPGWTYEHIGPARTSGRSIAGANGVLTVVGQSNTGEDAGLVMQVDAEDGTPGTPTIATSPGSGLTVFTGLANDGDDFAIVGGADTDDLGRQRWEGTLDEEGLPTQLTTSGGPGNDELFDVAVDDDGNRYLCGFVSAAGTGDDMFVRKVNSEGSIVWTYTAAGDANGTDRCFGVALAPQGTLLVAGYQYIAETGYDAVVRRLAR